MESVSIRPDDKADNGVTHTANAVDLRPIGQILLQDGAIGEDDLSKALAFQEMFGGRIGSILVRMGAIAEDRLLLALARQLGMSVVQPDELPKDMRSVAEFLTSSPVPIDWWIDQEVLAWDAGDGRIQCIATDPLKAGVQEIVSEAFPGRQLEWRLAATQDVDRSVDLMRRYTQADSTAPKDDIAHLRELAEEAPVVELVSNTLAQAFGEGASDIHFEPGERNFSVRYRLDGVLQSRLTLPRERFDAVASRIKLISGIDIAERRLPQDGRLAVRLSGQEIDVRVSSVPGVWGESIVLRLLPKERGSFQLEKLGMEPSDLERYKGWLAEPHGVILVTGPTGSGKSTTLYATLEAVNDGKKKIITVEDPVEYSIPGISQIQAHADIGYTFARALRAILRQDPDTIMIGEIRDAETAEIAVQASLTGHMVFSTLHTNDAIGAITRLVDMGIEPFLVVSALRAVLAQRLVRRVCQACAEPDPAGRAAAGHLGELPRRFPDLFTGPPTWRRGVGCRTCQGSGFKGRVAIYEMVGITPDLHATIVGRGTSQDLQRIVRQHGFRTLREDGLVKAWRGVTSLDEALRATGIGDE